ncbi:MAG TPA: ester cyclase [Dehalococcoidia bacterium]|nr:ester cyclase [Dehalococcoidia bacterium]
MSTLEENKVIMQRYFDELMNNQDYSKADEIIHEDFSYSWGGGLKGVEGHKQHIADLHSRASNLHIEILDMAVEENKAVVLQEWTAIHDKELFGIPATNKSLSNRMAGVVEFKDGKIFRSTTEIVRDMLSVFQQLGVLPSTEEIIRNYNNSLK